jgi:diaminohydroxyphosphoribosylaminopyrimidine deaminase/5-amino-6-(5-phosphoribosylamino)uracil reductase
MRRALTLAARAWGRTSPNPMVGAVVVRDGSSVGEGWHAEPGAPHAEVVALRAARDSARGATLYVTLEPCRHAGRTPPCVDAVAAAGIARVVYAAQDPNPVASGGAAILRERGLRVEGGLLADAARALNPAFHSRFERKRPYVTLKLAMSIDGAVADSSRTPQWLTGERARREAHRLRAAHDAIAVGSGTVLADDPQLTVRGVRKPRRPPARIIFDRRIRTPLTAAVVRTARKIPTILVTPAAESRETAALQKNGVELLVATNLPDALRQLDGRGIDSILCEGGAGLAAGLLSAGVVDRLVIFTAPLILGGNALAAFATVPPHEVATAPRWRVLETRRIDDDVMTVYVPAAGEGS